MTSSDIGMSLITLNAVVKELEARVAALEDACYHRTADEDCSQAMADRAQRRREP